MRHFKPTGYRRWFQNPRNVLIVVLVGSAAFVTVYFGNLETVPYTKRKHLVLFSRLLERRFGEHTFESMKAQYTGKILLAIHPDSIRVRLIANDIIESLQRGLKQENVRDVPYASGEFEELNVYEGRSKKEVVWASAQGKEENLEVDLGKEDEVLDDMWVQQSRTKGMESRMKSAMQHLDGLNWEVLVVNKPDVNAVCLPGGKIVVFTGLLEHLRTDAEIATIIGHEVAHVVARHAAEKMTKKLWVVILQLILYQFVMPGDLVNTMSSLFLSLPFSRRMETEADYIGLLLIASAGYDPRVAPKVFEKLDRDSAQIDYLSTHPSGKKRAQLLAQAKVMEEALSIYHEVAAGSGVEGFF
ncbi:hypothetical protein QQ045_015615 [Rhodiola kirilowii]